MPIDESPYEAMAVRVHCSFCGQSHSDATKVVAGPGVWICGHCIRSATRVLSGAGPSTDDTGRFELVADDEQAIRCSFCGRSPRRARDIVKGGPHIRAICRSCLDICNEVLAEDGGRVGKKRPPAK
jgi:ATP-dependent protease Clp ATPase subunit